MKAKQLKLNSRNPKKAKRKAARKARRVNKGKK